MNKTNIEKQEPLSRKEMVDKIRELFKKNPKDFEDYVNFFDDHQTEEGRSWSLKKFENKIKDKFNIIEEELSGDVSHALHEVIALGGHTIEKRNLNFISIQEEGRRKLEEMENESWWRRKIRGFRI